MKKKSKNIYLIIGLIALVIGGYYFYSHGMLGNKSNINGWYDAATKQCWVDKNTPPGTSYNPASTSGTFACCFNQNGEQIDCGDSGKLIGPKVLAIYGSMGGAGVPGKFFVQHGVQITNTGNFNIDSFTITNASWTAGTNGLPAGVTALNTAWDVMENRPSTSVAPGMATSFSSSSIDLQSIGATKPLTANYNLAFQVKASSYGGVLNQTSAPITGSISSQKEDIGFSVIFNWG